MRCASVFYASTVFSRKLNNFLHRTCKVSLTVSAVQNKTERISILEASTVETALLIGDRVVRTTE